MPRKISNAELQNKINTLPLSEILKMLKVYSNTNGVDISAIKNEMITTDLQNRLLANGINSCCPVCNSSNIVKNGSRNGIKHFKCKDCNKQFTLFTNTILEKTKYHWDIWVKVVEMVLNNIPMEHIQKTLITDYGLDSLDYKTVFLWKHKILNAIANLPMPKLSGIIQVDETFFREGQKGSRHLESTIKGETRKARYGRRPSKYGVMGNEFANVVCMTDLNGYTVSKVIGLGKLTVETFTDLFDEYIESPSYMCSDGNNVYKEYCNVKNIPLYIKPSNYVHTIQNADYITPDWSDPETAKKTEENNNLILYKLYYEELIDYIYNREDLSFKEFQAIKFANSLSLARVNQFHSELKRYIEYNTKGVSTKYLADYVGFYTYIRNWKVSNGHYPSSHKDAENILIDILKGKTTYTITDLKNACISLPTVSDKYMAMLKAKTKEMRKITKNPYFKYDEEDNVVSFENRTFLEDLPACKLNKLCTKYHISKKWAKYSKVSALLKQPNIHEDILQLIQENRHYNISEEDLQAIGDMAFAS